MKILHTSDWHLGRSLYEMKRYDEFEAFLDWLIDTIRSEGVEVLLVAGDVFHTTTPGNRAQALYYGFLNKAVSSGCRHVVIIGGNHDSPSFLNAPRELLRSSNVHVVGKACENLEDEVLLLKGPDGEPELIVCAVPYLHDRDVRTAEAGESIEDKERKLVEGICAHYRDVAAIAERLRDENGGRVPIVGMGHLFAAGGEVVEGEGVRNLYIGTLARVAATAFPPSFSYLALGHLHVPQRVGGSETVRYCGSPIAMGFGEARQLKTVPLVDLGEGTVSVTLLPVPVFRRLESISGDMDHITRRVEELGEADPDCYVEIIHDGEELVPDLKERIDTILEDGGPTVLRVRNNRSETRAISVVEDEEELAGLEPIEVFERCLDDKEIEEGQRDELRQLFRETIIAISESDRLAE